MLNSGDSTDTLDNSCSSGNALNTTSEGKLFSRFYGKGAVQAESIPESIFSSDQRIPCSDGGNRDISCRGSIPAVMTRHPSAIWKNLPGDVFDLDCPYRGSFDKIYFAELTLLPKGLISFLPPRDCYRGCP